MILSADNDTGGEIRWQDYGPQALTRRHVWDRAGNGNRTWEVDCQRFQRRWIDRLTAIQVGRSPARDESPESLLKLVVNNERFFPSKVFQNFSIFLSKSSPRL